ncbi:hypothetical protein EK904_001835 [Melospiza melodia maxima]|nr:hypothetical protein EK904_001835 [Melospiza melodia maxima]
MKVPSLPDGESGFSLQACDCFLMAGKQQPPAAVWHSEVSFSITCGRDPLLWGSFAMQPILKRHFDLSEKKRQKKVKATSDWRERRNAIRLTSEYTVETLVVADADMVQYHGAEAAQRFILTVMNMVYNMFQHQSLGIKVNIRVTKLVLLHSRPAKLSIGHHGERSLESFCQWQNEEYGGAKYLGNNQVPGARDDTPPVDAAVFVTRRVCKVCWIIY